MQALSAEPVELPIIQQTSTPDNAEPSQPETLQPRPETPSTSHPPSEQAESTNPTTPSSVQHPSIPAEGETTPVATKTTRSAKPAVLIIPAIPKSLPIDNTKPISETVSDHSQSTATLADESENDKSQESAQEPAATSADVIDTDSKPTPPAPKAWSTPKSWTGLFNPSSSTSSTTRSDSQATSQVSFGRSNGESLAEALKSFDAISNGSKVTFLEPRGLVNTGNMCYMNSVS